MKRKYTTSSGNVYIIDVEKIIDTLFKMNKNEVKEEAKASVNGKLSYSDFWNFLSNNTYDYWDLIREQVAERNNLDDPIIWKQYCCDENEISNLTYKDEYKYVMKKYSKYVQPVVKTLKEEIERFQMHKYRNIDASLLTLEDKLFDAIYAITSFVGREAGETVRNYLNDMFGINIPKAKNSYVE